MFWNDAICCWAYDDAKKPPFVFALTHFFGGGMGDRIIKFNEPRFNAIYWVIETKKNLGSRCLGG